MHLFQGITTPVFIGQDRDIAGRRDHTYEVTAENIESCTHRDRYHACGCPLPFSLYSVEWHRHAFAFGTDRIFLSSFCEDTSLIRGLRSALP